MRRAIRNWFYSLARCVVCEDAAVDNNLCTACADTLPVVAHTCERCALPLTAPGARCGECLLNTPAWDNAASAFAYRFPVDVLVSRTKYCGRLDMARALGAATAARLCLNPVTADLIVPIPLHWRRHWHRGFNQALELATPVARACDLPLISDLLYRPRATTPQTRLDATQRRDNLRDAFALRQPVQGLRIIVFDDVMTTGATAAAAATTLKAAGARHVRVWTCARAAPGTRPT